VLSVASARVETCRSRELELALHWAIELAHPGLLDAALDNIEARLQADNRKVDHER